RSGQRSLPRPRHGILRESTVRPHANLSSDAWSRYAGPLDVGQPATQTSAAQVDQVAQDQTTHVHRAKHLWTEARDQADLDPGLVAGRHQYEQHRYRDALHDSHLAAQPPSQVAT